MDEEKIYKAVEEELEKELPEEVEFIDALMEEQWSKVWLVIGTGIKKGFDLGRQQHV